MAEHRDEQRQDKREGWGFVSNRTTTPDGISVHALTQHGMDSVVLCGSTRFSSELASAFGTDSGFRINDTPGFGNAISRYIPGFRFGIEGECIYRPDRTIKEDIGDLKMEDLQVAADDSSISGDKLFAAIAQITGDDLLFLKRDDLSHQNEYRILWFGTESPDLTIDITCREAIQFCTRFEDLDAP